MISLYKTLVRPHTEYCVSAWSPYYKKDKELVEEVQRFTKMILNMEGLSYEDRLQSLKLWSLEERRNRQDLIEVFKTAKGMTRIRLQELFMLEELRLTISWLSSSLFSICGSLYNNNNTNICNARSVSKHTESDSLLSKISAFSAENENGRNHQN